MPPLDGTPDRLLSAVVMDLSRHPDCDWAVVIAGELLPIRFASKKEASTHLTDLSFGRHMAAVSKDVA